MASSAIKIRGLRRSFITPEGVDLRLELGSAGSRAGAFMIDLILHDADPGRDYHRSRSISSGRA